MKKSQEHKPVSEKDRWWKICMIMKLTLFMCVFLVVSTLGNGFSQQRITMQLGNTTIKKALTEFQRQTDKIVIYSDNNFSTSQEIVANFKDVEMESFLAKILEGSGMTYKLMKDYILILPLKVNVTDSLNQLKEYTIKGIVKDEGGGFMPGVTVLIKGTQVGVATDIEGKFEIATTNPDKLVLVFSFVGMQTVEIKYSGQAMINVVMKEAVNEMEEVTVVSTGYQTVNRKDMVGSYTVVKADDVMIPSYSTIDQMLQGQVAGMMIMNTSSRVGASPKIKIRGTATLLGNQDPLWVVDGIIQDDPIPIDLMTNMADDLKNILGNQISWLNPNDIETITVLKDASATAVYGSRASNGVIVVTTKKGKTGRMSINYSGSFSYAPAPTYDRFNYMNSQERIQFAEEAYNYGARYGEEPLKQPYTYEGLMKMYIDGDINQDEYLSRKSALEMVNTDWLDLLTRVTLNQTHSLSISGGTDKVSYRVSLGYNNNHGQELKNDGERLTSSISVGMQLPHRIKIDVGMNGTISKNAGYASGVNPLSYALSTSRALPAFDENGERLFYKRRSSYGFNNESETLSYNILNELDHSGSEVKNHRLSLNLILSWQLLDWLKYQFTGGYTYSNQNRQSFREEETYAVANEYRGYDFDSVEPDDPWFKAALLPFGGDVFTSDAIQQTYNIQNQLLISKTFAERHRLNMMLATEVRSTINEEHSNTLWGYVKSRGNKLIAPTAWSDFKPIGGKTQSGVGELFNRLYNNSAKIYGKTDNFFSLFATLAYSFSDRYVLNANFRHEASNRFGQDVNHRFDPEYSFGVSWRVSEEPFMQSQIGWLSQLNLKATYGIQGNVLQNIGPDLVLYQGGVAGVFNEYSSSIARIPNPNLSWERTRTWNFGVDLELFQKVSVVFEYYTRRSNAIIGQEIPYENGLSSMEINGGIIYNKGAEVTVNFVPVKTKDFALNVSVNSSKNWNTTGVGPSREPGLYEYLSGNAEKVMKKGYPVGAFWSYSFAGLNHENGTPQFNLLEVSEDKPYNGDPTSFLVYSGTTEPYFTGGVNLNARYKSFTLSTMFSLLLGGRKRLPSPYEDFKNKIFLPNETKNVSKDLVKRWMKPGDEEYTNIPALIRKDYMMEVPTGQENMIEMWENSDVMVVKSSFLRCCNLSLGWRMNPEISKKFGVSNLSLNTSVSNLFVIASKRFNGFDPELGDSIMPRNYSFSINIGF